MDNLRDKIIIVLVDKGLLAFVIAAFGFYLSRALENYKSAISVDSELLKIRANLGREIIEKSSDVESAYLNVALKSPDAGLVYAQALREYIPLLRQVQLCFSNGAVQASSEFSDLLLRGPRQSVPIAEIRTEFFEARKRFLSAISEDVRRLASTRRVFWSK